MSELFSNLGITGPAFIAQAANFLIVLIVLGFFVYKPLSKMMEERSRKIAAGLEGAKRADARLKEIEQERGLVLEKAEQEALGIVSESRGEAREAAKEIISGGEARAASIIKEGKTLSERQRAEEMVSLERESKHIVRMILEKTVSLSPKQIDEKLIDEAVKYMKDNPSELQAS